MNGNKLDDLDLKILNVLQEDGRLDAQKISKRVNLTRTPVYLRIEKLMEAGIIQKIVAVVDRTAVGLPVLAITQVKLHRSTADRLAEFERLVIGLPEVTHVYHVAGDWNFVLHISARSPQEYWSFLKKHISSLKNVELTESAFVLGEAKVAAPLPCRRFV